MNITQEVGAGSYVIRGYDHQRVVVNDAAFTRSLIISADYLDPGWEPQVLADLATSHLGKIIALQPEVVLLGTGERMEFPKQEIAVFFLQRGIGFESMGTAAACRTFNLLVSEGRTVAAGLLVR
jgi:uncharacterized protein